MLASFMETQIWHPPVLADWIGGGFNKGTVVSAGNLVPERAAPPVLSQKPDNSVLPFMPLTLSERLSLCWS